MTWAELRGDVAVLACAASAGIHAALAPEHFSQSVAAGVSFAAAAGVLATLAIALTRAPTSSLALAAAGLVLVGLLASYGLATTTGLPVLQPDPEPVDGLALATKAIEAVGLFAVLPLTKGTPTWTPHGLRAPSRSR